jgi:hypothetical protein
MQPTSPAFAAAVRSSHQVVTRADLYYDGRLIVDDLPVTAGTVTIDDDADIRTTATMTIADPYGRLTPVVDDMNRLSVYGHEIYLRQGLVITPHGRVELVALGWLRVQNVKVTERFRRNRAGVWVSGGAVLEVEALDRMAGVDDYRFLTPEQPAAGATCLAEIRRLVDGRLRIGTWPAVTDPAVPADLVYDDSRTTAIRALATAANVKAYVDRDGNLMIRPRALAVTGDLTLTGDPDGGLIAITAEWSRDGVANAVIARGEATDKAPVQAIAYEDDPSSPTRWDGPYGRVPAFYSSPVITTPAQAAAAATTRLNTYLAGRDRVVTMTAVPNPAADPGSTVITVQTPRETMTGRLLAMDLPLAPGAGAGSLTIRIAPGQPTRAATGDTVTRAKRTLRLSSSGKGQTDAS